MTGPFFVDTNVLVYADDDAEPARRDRARSLIRKLTRERSGKLSIQVLQEYFAVATRKLGMSAEASRRRVELYSRWDVVSLAAIDVLGAIDLHRLYRWSIWDALIYRAALISGCRTLISEDLQDGLEIEALKVVNPFRKE